MMMQIYTYIYIIMQAEFKNICTFGPNIGLFFLSFYITMDKSIRKVIVLGSGALKIGEAGEFDYSGSQALKPCGKKVSKQY